MRNFDRRHPSPRSHFGRRRMLASLGAGALAAPFVPLLQSAAGGPETPPKRLVMFFSPHGTIRDEWLPTGGETDFVLPTILQPLEPFRDRTLVIDGLEIVPSGPPGGMHTVGPAYLFTGSPMLEGDLFLHEAIGTPHGWNSGPSIDQVIADEVSAESAFHSLVLGIQSSGYSFPGSRISYRAAEQPVAPLGSPQQAFDLLFGDAGLDTATALKLKAERLAVIDAITPDLQSLRTKLGVEDRMKIDAHLAAIESIGQQLQNTFTCAPPDIGEEVTGPFDPAAIEPLARQQLDILAAALSCRGTNVASVMARVGENDDLAYPFLGFTDTHHNGLSHAPDEDLVAKGKSVQIYRWYAEQLAYLCEKLDAIIEPDGSTVLDNTIIVWGSEIAKGNTHSWQQMPFVVLGGGGGALDTGRFVQVPGQNHCRLLVAIANAMGLPLTAFGGFDDGGGALTEILV